ncbi:MAG TPA: penicillin acylase family protein [Acidobacteriota bacterium]
MAVAGGLILAFYAAGRLYFASFHPEVHGRLKVDGIRAPVRILRDQRGIPHLRGASAADTLFGLGLVHAQDRLFQMELMRRAAGGRLAELFGAKLIDQDRLLRLLDLRGTARRALRALRSPERRELEAYVAGVNAGLSAGAAAVELELLRTRPQPWSAIDSLSISLLEAWVLSTNIREEALALYLAARWPGERIAALFPSYPGAPPAEPEPLPAVDASEARLLRAKINPLSKLASPNLGSGLAASNNWVIAPRRSRSGRALLANDPHLTLTFPALWYLADLRGGDLEAAGVTIPGVPYIVIGHTPKLAWGFTNLMADNTDLVILPQWPDRVRRERIAVRGGDEVVMEIALSSEGPVLPREETGGVPVAIAWGVHRWPAMLPGFAALNRARDLGAARAALIQIEAIAQSAVLADASGAIGYQATGAIPRRRSPPSPFPRRQGDARRGWDGRVPAAELPAWGEPPEGFVATANQRIAALEPEPTRSWAAPYRHQRIAERLSQPGPLELAELAQLQLDVESLQWRAFRPAVAAMAQPEGFSADLHRQLLAWDGRLSADSRGALAFEVFRLALMEELLADDLGPFFADYLAASKYFYQVLDAAMNDPQHPLWDDRTTPGPERRSTIILRALDHAAVDLMSFPGNRPYGSAHRLTLRHPLGAKAWLRWLFNGPTVATGGDINTVGNGAFEDLAPFDHIDGPSMRFLADLRDLEHARFAYPGGQSGHLVHRHRSDLLAPWRDGSLVPLMTRDAEIRANLEAELILVPN